MTELQSLPIRTTPDIAAAIEALGRCEDLAFSTDGTRLAIAAFARSLIAVLDLEPHEDSQSDSGAAGFIVSGCTLVNGGGLQHPHGVSFVDRYLMVADREASVLLIDTPPRTQGVVEHTAQVRLQLTSVPDVTIGSPGSARATELADGIIELVVCSNYLHRLTRHFIDLDNLRSLRDEIMLTGGRMHMPDGVAITSDRRWLAVASPDVKRVLIYDFAGDFTMATVPATELKGPAYPHGMCFSPDDEHLLVTDADQPFLHVFGRGTDWGVGDGGHVRHRVMDDATFALHGGVVGEGGPKGVAVHPHGHTVAVAAQAWALRVYRSGDVLGDLTIGQPVRAAAPRRPLADEILRGGRLMDEIRWRMRAMAEMRATFTAELAERDRKIAVLEQWFESRVPRA